MSAERGIGQGDHLGTRTQVALVEVRRSIRSTRLGSGTLACPRCDAPVALGDGSRPVTDALTCPFCGHHAPARDFLSLALPTRPARVVVRVRSTAHAPVAPALAEDAT